MHFLLIPDSQVYEIHLVIHHGVHVDGDAVPGEDLLGWDVESPGPQINTPEVEPHAVYACQYHNSHLYRQRRWTGSYSKLLFC